MFTSLQNQYNQLLERAKALLSILFSALLSGVMPKLRSFAKIGTESAHRIRRRQFLLGGCLVGGFIALAYGIMAVLFEQGPVQTQEDPKPVPINIATAPSQINMNEARWNNLDISIKTLTQKVSTLNEKVFGKDQDPSGRDPSDRDPSDRDPSDRDPSNGSITTGQGGNTNNSNLSQGQDTPNNSIDGVGINDTGVNDTRVDDTRFQALETRLSFLETERTTASDTTQPRPLYAQNPGTPEEQDGRVIQKLAVSLVNKSKDLKTVETTIPAGAFAKTVLLSGLDASSAMNASSDPRPMLLRIIDHGTLPRRFQSDLKDCHCTAGAFGDLSSERVYARLEKLTCIERSTGEIIETQVAGYVAGSDGKAGIRGVVASKDGQFLLRSLMGGVFSGLSNVANPQNRKPQMNPFVMPGAGAAMAGPTLAENFTSGMAGGATTALDRLSQYYIDRAEQLQPVIQIAAGQVVDIVFTEGASLLPSNQSSVVSHQNNKGEIKNESN